MALTKPAPHMLNRVDWVMPTVAAMKAETRYGNTARVQTRGYFSNGDSTGAVYTMVRVEDYSGTPDGYGDHLTNDGRFVAVLEHDGVFHGEWFGIVDGQNATDAFAAADTYIRAYMAEGDGNAAEWKCSAFVTIDSPISIGGAGVIGLNLDWSAMIITVVSGGTLTATDAAFTIRITNASLHMPLRLYCEKICSGYRFRSCSRSVIHAPFAHKFASHADAYGVKQDNVGSSGSGNSVIYDMGGFEWAASDTEFNTESNFLASSLVVNCADSYMINCAPGWAKRNIYVGTGATNTFFISCHPFNGNPNATGSGEDGEDGAGGPPRDEPFNVVSDAKGKVYFLDSYFDNGYIIDNTGRVQIDGGRHLILNVRVTLNAPYIRVKYDPTGSNNKGSIHNMDSSVGYFLTSWSTVDPAWSDLHDSPTEQRGNSRFIRALRRMMTVIPEEGDDPYEIIVKRGGKIVQEYRVQDDEVMEVRYGDGDLRIVCGGGNRRLLLGTGTVGIGEENGDGGKLKFYAGGDTRWLMENSDGKLIPTTDNARDIGTSAARVREIFTGKINASALPTSASGLDAGDVWNDSGTLKVVT